MKRVVAILALIAGLGLLTACAQAAPPAPPSSISVFAPAGQNGDALRVVFGASSDDGGGNNDVVRYRMERMELPGGAWSQLPNVTATDAASYTVTNWGLKKNTKYRYRVAANNGELSTWVVGAGTTQDTQAPRPPKLDAADRPSDQGRGIVLTITASPDDGGGADDVVSYEIRRRPAGGSFTFVRTVPATGAAQYVVTDWVDSKTLRYDYKVRAFDGTLYSKPAMDSAVGRDNLKPRPPRNFKATDVANDQGKQLRLTWAASLDDGTGVDDVRTYRLQRRPAGGSFAGIAVIRANNSATYEYLDGGLAPGQTYTYRLVAFDGRNVSDPVFATGKTTDNRAPRPPSGLQVADRPNDQGDALILSWNASGDDGARADDVIEYHVLRKPGPNGEQALTLVAKVPATNAATYKYTDTGLTPKRKYDYAVKAFDGRNLSTAIFGSGTPLDQKAPRPPSNVVVTDVPKDNGGAVKVSFTGSPDDGAGADDVKSYEISRRRAGGALAVLRTLQATNSQLYEFTDTSVVTGATYTYGVRAFDGTLYSTGAFGSGSAADNTPPAPPTSFAVAVAPNAAGAADITFTASVDDTAAHPEVTQYEIQRTRKGQAWPSAPTITVTAKRLAQYAAKDAGLTVGLTYVYRARAKAGTGFSVWTPWRNLTAADTRKPAPPRELTAADRPDDTGEAVLVGWKRSLDDGAGRNIVARYRVYRKLTSVFETPSTLVKTVTATGAATYQVLDEGGSLMNLRSYTYWAVAVSGTGIVSDNSNEAEAVPRNDTILAAPTNLTAADRPGGGNAIDLAWKRSSSEDGGITPPPPPFGGDGSTAEPIGDYEVFRRRGSSPWPATPYMVVPARTQGDPLAVVDNAAPNGVAFEYKVRYRVETSISPFSNIARATARDDSADAADAGLSVAITDAPASVAAGAPIAVTVSVTGEGLSTAALRWRVNQGDWQQSATRTGRDSYEAAFTLAPGNVAPGDVLDLAAVAADATVTVLSDEVRVEITR
jgi:hypothetical protein